MLDQPHTQTVLRDKRERHPHGGNLVWVLARKLLDLSIIANVLDASGLDALQASDGLEQLSLPTVRDSRNPQYLSAEKGRERHVVELRVVIPHGESFTKMRSTGSTGVGRSMLRHLMANHHVGHLLGSRLGGDHLAHVLSLAKHHHAVADFLHLVGR